MTDRRSRLRISALAAPAVPLLAVVIMGVVGIALLQGDGETLEPLPTPGPDARSYLNTLRVSQFDNAGQRVYRATADRAVYFTDGSLDLDTVVVDYLGGDDGRWQLTAPDGTVPPEHDTLHLAGEVDVNGTDDQGSPIHFATPRLTVGLVTRVLRTDAPVVLETVGKRMRAVGLETNFTGTRIDLLSDVEAVVDG